MSTDLFEPFQLMRNRADKRGVAEPSTFYGGSEVGYTDYPFYNDEETQGREGHHDQHNNARSHC